MEVFPKGCRARNDAILKRGSELLDQFYNGNRKDVHSALLDMEPRVALAVVTYMMVTAIASVRDDIAAFMREAA